MNEDRKWVGRGNEDVPGKPFGWAHNRERAAIRDHLIRRGWTGADLYFRISRIQERLRRDQPTWRERQAAWKGRQPKPTSGSLDLSLDELNRLIDHFEGANDPISASIAAKARAKLNSLIV